MPRLTASKEEIKGLPVMPEGIYTVRLDGFKPKYSKDKGSVNLNPQLKVINHAQFNDRNVFEFLNSKAKWVWNDFHHCFGVQMAKDAATDETEFVGFDGPEDDPEKWTYSGPLLAQQGQLYLIQAERGGTGPGSKEIVNKIKYYVCRVPGCQEKHSQNLAK